MVLPFGEYCAFTKSLERLGDRWSLLIVRNLAVLGPLGFNGIADSLPGISRSVLARRLRTLDELGIIARAGAVGSIQHAPYRLTPAGEQLMPTLLSLRSWAERWVPEDPSIADHDPDVIVWWLIDRVDPAAVPDRPVVLALEVAGIRRKNVWLLLEPGAVPSVCVADPDLPLDRYVYIQATAVTLLPIARGARTWSDAVAAGDVRIFGEPSLVPSLSNWFRAEEQTLQTAATALTSRSAATLAEPEGAARVLTPAAAPQRPTHPGPRSGSRRLLTRAQHLSGAPSQPAAEREPGPGSI